MKQNWLWVIKEKEREHTCTHTPLVEISKRRVRVSVYGHLRGCPLWVDLSRSTAEKSSPHPLQVSWGADRTFPVCSGLTYGTEAPTPPLTYTMKAGRIPISLALIILAVLLSCLEEDDRPASPDFLTTLMHVNHCRNSEPVCMWRPCSPTNPLPYRDEKTSEWF